MGVCACLPLFLHRGGSELRWRANKPLIHCWGIIPHRHYHHNNRLSMSAEPLLLSLRSCVDSSSLASSLLSSEQFTFHLAAVVQVLHGLGYCLLIITVVIIIITTSLLSTVIIRITMVYFLLSSYSQWSNFYLSRGPAAVFFFFLLLRTGQTVQQLVCLTDCWFFFWYVLILTSKIPEMTS